MMMNVKKMLGLAAAFACVGLQAEPYADRWLHGSRKLNTEADVEFYENLVGRMGKSGYNGLVISKGIEGVWQMKGAARARWMKLKDACDRNGIEIIPLVWSLGYGTMIYADPTVIESEPALGFPYVVKNGKAIAGLSEDGKTGAFIVTDYRGKCDKIFVELKGLGNVRRMTAYCLDSVSNLSRIPLPVSRYAFLPRNDDNSAAYFITYEFK